MQQHTGFERGVDQSRQRLCQLNGISHGLLWFIIYYLLNIIIELRFKVFVEDEPPVS